jgi:aryl-alcohol dehydrogenase-like predicted oxidoreductase
MTFGTPVEEADAIRLVHAAFDMGINFIDTANIYEGYARYLGSAGGVAEEITGKALLGRREKMILATKVGAPVGPGPQDRGLSAVHILRQLDCSLRRLQTDYIDLYIIHWPDKYVPLETTLAAMETAVRQGKIRHFGASNHSAWQLCEMLWIAQQQSGPPVVSSQIPLSMLRREFHHDLPFCLKYGIGVTPYQSLQGGLLTGKYRRGQAPPSGSRGAEKPDWIWKMDDALFDRLERIESKRVEQIREAVSASGLSIPTEHFVAIDEICPPPWQQPDPVRG